jgi:hypothetical protein
MSLQTKKRCSLEKMAHHHQKFSVFKDDWKECLIFGRWLTVDKSCVAGWYHSLITQGPDPNPICTGTTIHSLTITHGNRASYKVQVCVFRRAMNGDLGKPDNNTITNQKWANLLLLMLNDFKNKGHCITMVSAYIGSIMATIGHDVWRINMVGIAQANHTGANIDYTKLMKKEMYNSICWQHVWQSLCFSVLSNNALVRILSNFHGPEIFEVGMGVLRKERDSDGKRERTKTEVPCSA